MFRKLINQISTLYYHATPKTIEQDVTKAVQLLKLLPAEQTRAKAAVFMDGLSQMQSEWRLDSQKSHTEKQTLRQESKRTGKPKIDGSRTRTAKKR